ncbi:hypothetical protein GA0111570_11195 [Raineyella antarctica]|uniref:Peptidase S1 domain-containing protein n=1 Tax=Raineyella antarctica TaxID=1577474 RepID=A0A1G6HMJ4_9ACTN|nr:trypsin-like serine protease [Raineyella antarctica]SDB95489.1 hypothetical protein GA0111570_11195 [Raineyella antarctica]
MDRRLLTTVAVAVVLVSVAYVAPIAAQGHLPSAFRRPPTHTAARASTTPTPGGAAATAASTPAASTPTASATPTPTRTLKDMHAWIVQASCTADVLDSPSGSWLLTAAHCGASDSVQAAGRTWTVVDEVTTADVDSAGADTEDLRLLRVDGNIEAAVGGGFVVGTAPADGAMVSIWGYPSATGELTGCDALTVSAAADGLSVDSCNLPDGTSGSPWYGADGVLRGLTGGPNEGGTSDWDSESIRFTDGTVSWIRSVVG